MAKIILVAGHLVSEAHGALALALRLRADGHDIILSGSGSALSVFEAGEFRTIALPRCDLNRFVSKLPPPDGLRDWLPTRREARRSAVLKANGADSLAEALEGERPDLVIAHVELHEHIISTISQNIPLVLFTRMFHGGPGTQMPPRTSGEMPDSADRASRAKIAHLWFRLWAWKRWQRMRRWYAEAGADPATVLKAYARSRNVNLRRLASTWWYQYPWAYRSFPILVMQARELDFPLRPHSCLKHVGHMSLPSQPLEDVGKVVDLLRGAGPPRIFASFGSILSFHPDLLARIWEVFRRNPDWTGVFASKVTCSERPPNVHVVEWAPQNRMLQFADLCITHGGAGTIAECVEAEVPMLLFPRTNTGLMGNAARVVFHGLGRTSKANASVDTIEADVCAVLDDASIRSRLHAMAAVAKAYETDKVAERAVHEILSDRAAE